MKIIAFTGLKGSGKTTAALGVIEGLGLTGPPISFADPLRQAASAIFGLTMHQMKDPDRKEAVIPGWGLSPRQILQQLGTEVCRQFDPDIWLKNLLISAEGRYATVVDDCRFLNEAEGIKNVGGIVIGIKRPGTEIDNHVSELQMTEHWGRMVDHEVDNISTIEDLHQKVLEIINKNYPGI